ncbi:phage tail sheath C-terminal domain-containing protein, partial [Xanthomonas albilineans]
SGLLPPRAGNRFLFEDRQALLNFGIATSFVSGGQLRVERAITTYQQNSFGAPDSSYLDSETLHTSAYVLRALKSVITSKYPRHKLADDGTRFAAGQAIVTPAVIKGELCAIYGQMEYMGIVENLDTFKQHLIVERDPRDPNRVNVLFPPDYVNQLRVFAVLNQFRLQYPTNQIVN